MCQVDATADVSADARVGVNLNANPETFPRPSARRGEACACSDYSGDSRCITVAACQRPPRAGV